MKVLHVLSLPAAGGAEVYVKDLAKTLTRSGHETHIGFLGKAADVGRSVEYEKKFLSELDAAGVKYFFIGNDARRRFWRGIRRVSDYVRREKIDVYHAHLTYGILFGALLRIPRVYTHHNIVPRVPRLLYRALSACIDRQIAISDICAKSLREYSGRPVELIFNAVDEAKIEKKASFDVQGDVVKAIAVGRIHPQKNYALLVDAVAALSAEARNRFVLRIAGEGPEPLVNTLRAKIQRLKLEKNIILLGNRSDIPSLLQESHLFIMSSAWEGLPIALLEATVTGLPCVVTDVGGCAEVIKMGGHGMVVPPNDCVALSNAIEQLIRTPSLLLDFATRAQSKGDEFSIRRACAEHVSLYEEAIQRQTSTRFI